MLQANPFEELRRVTPVCPLAGEAHPQDNVLQRRKCRQQIECLKDEPDLQGTESITSRFAQRCHICPVDDDRSGICRRDAGYRVEQGRLATTAAADQNHLLGIAHFKRFDIQNIDPTTTRLGKTFLQLSNTQRHFDLWINGCRQCVLTVIPRLQYDNS